MLFSVYRLHFPSISPSVTVHRLTSSIHAVLRLPSTVSLYFSLCHSPSSHIIYPRCSPSTVYSFSLFLPLSQSIVSHHLSTLFSVYRLQFLSISPSVTVHRLTSSIHTVLCLPSIVSLYFSLCHSPSSHIIYPRCSPSTVYSFSLFLPLSQSIVSHHLSILFSVYRL